MPISPLKVRILKPKNVIPKDSNGLMFLLKRTDIRKMRDTGMNETSKLSSIFPNAFRQVNIKKITPIEIDRKIRTREEPDFCILKNSISEIIINAQKTIPYKYGEIRREAITNPVNKAPVSVLCSKLFN